MKKLFLLPILLLIFYCSHAQSGYDNSIKKADSLTTAKSYLQAAKVYTAAFKGNKSSIDCDDRYNAACVWALAGNIDSAFSNLDEIVGTQYFDYDHITTDKDLSILYADKRWLPLLDKIKTAKPGILTIAELNSDIDLLISALKEAHTGLYWYNTHPQFDSICMAQKAKIKAGMNTLDFYNIVAPIVAFTKEGHTYLHLDDKDQAWARFSGLYFPFFIKFLNKRPYIINNAGNLKTQGLILTAVNGESMEQIMKKFLSYEPSDGFNTTSKYRWIEQGGNFSKYYLKCYPQKKLFSITLLDPETGNKITHNSIQAISYDNFNKSYQSITSAIPNTVYLLPAILQTDSTSHTATLTFNTFNRKWYKLLKMDFHSFVKSAFEQIAKQKIEHLIIDIRKNGGGSEGYEDYLLSYLINKDYTKYKYVQASAFTYSFYRYTDYKNDWKSLDSMLTAEHYLEKDGRILRKPGVEAHEKPQPNPFKGDIYILTSGLTYSGGAEFASLAKNYTNAVFIGEEVGGGYYGNTSGNRITLKLPYSKLEIGIPILKFVVNTPKEVVPFGHGVLPDHEVQPGIKQFLSGYDAEMTYAMGLIKGEK